MATPAAVSLTPETVFEIREMASLPCGCVAAAYEARSLSMAMIAIEAKGPHCILGEHAIGRTLQLGDLAEFDL